MEKGQGLEALEPTEKSIAVADLRDQVEATRKAQRKLGWTILLPAVGGTAFFGATLAVAPTPEPSLALLFMFGIGASKALKKFLALGKEIRSLESEIGALFPPHGPRPP
jgi:hypothetical protein